MSRNLATERAVPLPPLSERHIDPHSYPDGVAFLDGQYLPMSQAKISVLDWGFLHSDATYDTVHVWDGRFFRLDLHLDRFFGRSEQLRLTIPFDRDGVAEILHDCVALSGHRAAYVEMICTRGASPTFTATRARRSIASWPSPSRSARSPMPSSCGAASMSRSATRSASRRRSIDPRSRTTIGSTWSRPLRRL